jgi:hypothetical protein
MLRGVVARTFRVVAVFIVAVLLPGASLPACRSQCTLGETRCSGNALESCISTGGDGVSGSLEWSPRTCVGSNAFCVELGSGAAICAATSTQAPECAGGVNDACWQNIPAGCRNGYVVLAALASPPIAGSGIPCAAPNPYCVAGVGCVASQTQVCGDAGLSCWQGAPSSCVAGYVNVNEACIGVQCDAGCPEAGGCPDEASCDAQ